MTIETAVCILLTAQVVNMAILYGAGAFRK